MNFLSFSCIIVATLFALTAGKETTFTNPILDRNSADPSVLKLGDYYYLTISEVNETELTIYKSPILTSFRNATKHVAYTTKNGQINLWASEMHEVKGQLYIYFTMEIPSQNKPHVMYALKAEDPKNPMGKWSEPVQLMPEWPWWAIDGSVLKHANGKIYFVWSSTGNLDNQNALWISEMYDGLNISSKYAVIRQPQHDWERRVDEGPYFIYKNNVSFLVYSAGSTFDPDYFLGLMSIEGDKDPMIRENWWQGDDQPVFAKDEGESVYTTGHASFTVSNDETETWMVYHAVANTSHVLGYRTARIEKIDWDSNGRPVFPKPHGYNHPQPVPSGHPIY